MGEPNKAIRQYFNHLMQLWNVKELQGDEDQLQNAKKVISCFVDPRNDWLLRTPEGLCKQARISKEELQEVLDLNKTTFMAQGNKIALRLQMLGLVGPAITLCYQLDR